MNILFIGNGFDKSHSINIEFDEFIKSKEFALKMKRYISLFNDGNYKRLYENTKLWSRLEDFCFEIIKDIKINKKIFYNNLSSAFIDWFNKTWTQKKLNAPKNIFIEKLINKKQYYSIFSFNYTNTAEKYGYDIIHSEYGDTWKKWTLDSIKQKLINMHYCINKKNIFIIGNDQEQKINKNYLIQNWEKKETINHKINYLELLLRDKHIKQIDFYGFSFGNSDTNMTFFLFDFVKKGGKVNIYDKWPENIEKQINKILKGKRYKKEYFKRVNYIKV